MNVFLILFAKIIPLYGLIVLGYLAGKKLSVTKEVLAALLIYIITPVVVFQGVASTRLSVSTLSLPLLFFSIACILCLIFYAIGGSFWNDSRKNILAFAAGSGNTGYFGIPVALALFGQNVLGLVVLCTLGTVLYENTLGFFMVARGSNTARESLKRLLRLPSLYAFIFGVIFNLAHFHIGQNYVDMLQNFKGAYSVLGVMLIGLGVSAVDRMSVDAKFISLTFLAKFLAWPLMVALVILVDKNFVHLYTPALYSIFIMLSVVPIAANTVAYAAALNANPQKAALAVLASTIFALFYIPLMVSLFVH